MIPPARQKVIIFSDHLLYPSETFIHAQASALSEFEPVYAGSRMVAGLDLSEEQVYTINQGNARGQILELSYKLFGFAPHFTQRLRALNPFLLHAHYGPNGLRALPIAEELAIPLIVTFHGSDASLTDLRYQKTSYGFRRYVANKGKLSKSSALFLAVSKFIRRKLLEQAFPEERVLVHYTGVDTRIFHPASTEEGPVILFVGRLVESKGVEFLIKATSEIQKQAPAVELVLIGEGPLRAVLEEQAKQSLRRYRFLGVRKPAEVREWMNRASVLCLPSVTRRSGEEEAFGMVCAEAQAVGKPVVAFDSGGISEVVSHGNTGFLATEGDWRALAKYLFALLEDPKLRERFGLAGRELVVRQFDLEDRTRALERIYAMAASTDARLGKAYHGPILQSSAVRSSRRSSLPVQFRFGHRLGNSNGNYSSLLFWLAHSPPRPPESDSLAERAGAKLEAMGRGGYLARSRARQGAMAISEARPLCFARRTAWHQNFAAIGDASCLGLCPSASG
jgi:colanic acid/amylovoran biosynthesis glycosyltransferase